MKLPDQKPTLQFIFTNEFGDKTEIKKELSDSSLESLFWAIRESLAGCGFGKESIEEWFSEETWEKLLLNL